MDRILRYHTIEWIGGAEVEGGGSDGGGGCVRGGRRVEMHAWLMLKSNPKEESMCTIFARFPDEGQKSCHKIVHEIVREIS